MRNLLFAFIALSLAACSIEGTTRLPYEPDDAPPPTLPDLPEVGTRRLVILHTNDEHSHLLGFGPNSEYPYLPTFGADGIDEKQTELDIDAALDIEINDPETQGGIVRRQFLINRERAHAAENGDAVLLVSAGDVMMGTLFHATYPAGQAPDYLAMYFLGYDYIAIGNHEFDFGPDMLAGAIRSAHQLSFGGTAPLLSANIGFEGVVSGGAGSGLKALYGDGDSGAPIMPWSTKVLSNGLKVGVFGLVGYEAAFVAPSKSPIAFSRPESGASCYSSDSCASGLSCVRSRCVDLLDEAGHRAALAGDAQDAVDDLIAEGVDLVIALSHSGVEEDEYLAAHTTGIDVIVGGHSHDEVAPTTVNGTVIVQAGNYGRKLGRLVLDVDEDGSVTVVTAQSELLPVDSTVDALVRNDEKALETAVGLTAGVIGALIGGLNEALLEALVYDLLDVGKANGDPLDSIVEPLEIVTSDHDIIGELEHQESNLAHLVTDAVLQQMDAKKGSLPNRPMVVVEANGVLRETLRFGNDNNRTTLADVFRVLPLGASPWEDPSVAAPGYPMLLFTLTPEELMQGIEIGVTQGLVSDSFFLTYSGMWVEYDRNRPDLDCDPTCDWNTGHVTRIDIEESPFGNIYTLYNNGIWMDASGSPINPADESERIMIVTNVYIGGFLDTYGLSPRDEDGQVIGNPATDDLMTRLIQTALCTHPYGWLAEIFYCVTADIGDEPPWDLVGVALPDLKEWEMLLMYLDYLGGETASGQSLGTMYQGATVDPAYKRVIDVTP